MRDHQGESRLRRIARKIAAVIAECNDAQRRLLVLWLSPERYALSSRLAPDTYAEFMYRTSGPLLHEPSARARMAHTVR